MSGRSISERELCHDRLGDEYGNASSRYDTARRVEVLVNEFLSDEDVRGREILDVGCGLGDFSEALARRGGRVTASDLGPGMVERTKRRVGCEAVVADALRLEDKFGAARFDVVVSSECIEHTPDPEAAVAQMLRVLRPGGLLSVSTPNVLWWPVVAAASKVKFRPFDGLENFSSWRGLRGAVRRGGGTIVREKGLHLFPFQFRMHGLSRYFDEHAQWTRGLMINMCVLARREDR